MIAEVVVNFNATRNTTVLKTANKILKDSVNQSNNGSNVGGFQVDPTHAFISGKRVTLIRVKPFCFYPFTVMTGDKLILKKSLKCHQRKHRSRSF